MAAHATTTRAGAPAAAPDGSADPASRSGGGRRGSQVAKKKAKFDAVTVLTCYVFFAMFIPSNLTLPGMGGVGTPANVVALLGLMWFLAAWLAEKLVPAPGTRAPRIAMVIFATSVLLGYIACAGRPAITKEMQGADRGLIALLAWTSLVAVSSAGIPSRERLYALLRRTVVMASIVAALGWYDFLTHSNIANSLHIPGLQSASAGIDAMTRGAFTRPRGTTAHPLEFSGMLSMMLPFAVQQAFDPARFDRGRLRRWLPVLLIGGALPLSVSRTGIIGVVVALGTMLPAWQPRRRGYVLGAVGFGVVGLGAAVPGLLSTLTGLFSSFFANSDSSTQARAGDYAKIWEYMQSSPWFGHGMGTFLPELYFFTDNMYLNVAAELGVYGVLVLVLIFVAGIHNGGAARRLAPDQPTRELAQCFVAAATVALITSATFDSLGFPMFAGIYFLLLGCGGSLLGFLRSNSPAGAGR
ncbi:O-antigen polymerase [Kitasatospora sp. MMS16-BH015]|uniref:O-antigen ligase family protein n=1 Tax=Kitasatospora sp. MMS16-BH015 TaxID=2018025 RepID=UPI000CA28BCD|nr:O-antigen ligase family protein [Kitasatospora sp. MMS16-BH015]AUG76346.1 O-antigen polymerase [Kitasatospora sp. MMS16-BH015]